MPETKQKTKQKKLDFVKSGDNCIKSSAGMCQYLSNKKRQRQNRERTLG